MRRGYQRAWQACERAIEKRDLAARHAISYRTGLAECTEQLTVMRASAKEWSTYVMQLSPAGTVKTPESLVAYLN